MHVDELTTNPRKGDGRIEYQPDALLTVANAPQYFNRAHLRRKEDALSYNNQFPASSLLAIPVTATPATPAQQIAPSVFKTPTMVNLPSGQYSSQIIDVAVAVQNGQVVGIDCFHQLTDSSGRTYHMRFRYYAPHEVDALVETVASYGLTGSLGALLQGLQESVDVTPKAPPSNYMYIAQRTLHATTLTATVSSSTTTLPETYTPIDGSSTTASSPTPCKGGGLSSRRKFGSKQPTMSRQKATLLSEDDEDDDDDWLNEDED